MPSNNSRHYALVKLLEWIGEGRRLSEATAAQRKLIKLAERTGYVERRRIRNDYIVSPTERPI